MFISFSELIHNKLELKKKTEVKGYSFKLHFTRKSQESVGLLKAPFTGVKGLIPSQREKDPENVTQGRRENWTCSQRPSSAQSQQSPQAARDRSSVAHPTLTEGGARGPRVSRTSLHPAFP